MATAFSDETAIFQKDSAPYRIVQVVLKCFFLEHDITALPWPPDSPEHLWGVLN